MKSLLILNAPPGLEEDMVDYLLTQPGVGGFTSYQTMGHGEHENMSIAEQVSGRRKRIQFEVLTDQSIIQDLLNGLQSAVGKDITFWVLAVHKFGRT